MDDGPGCEAIITTVPASAPDHPAEPLLAILVANWNTAALIERCVEGHPRRREVLGQLE